MIMLLLLFWFYFFVLRGFHIVISVWPRFLCGFIPPQMTHNSIIFTPKWKVFYLRFQKSIAIYLVVSLPLVVCNNTLW